MPFAAIFAASATVLNVLTPPLAAQATFSPSPRFSSSHSSARLFPVPSTNLRSWENHQCTRSPPSPAGNFSPTHLNSARSTPWLERFLLPLSPLPSPLLFLTTHAYPKLPSLMQASPQSAKSVTASTPPSPTLPRVSSLSATAASSSVKTLASSSKPMAPPPAPLSRWKPIAKSPRYLPPTRYSPTITSITPWAAPTTAPTAFNSGDTPLFPNASPNPTSPCREPTAPPSSLPPKNASRMPRTTSPASTPRAISAP